MSRSATRKKKQKAAPADRSPAPEKTPLWKRLYPFSLLLLPLALYWPAVDGPFVLDDYDLKESFSTVMTPNRQSIINSGRPLLMLTFIANHRMAGEFDPFTFHVTGILLHGLNSLLVWLFARALFARGRLDEWISPAWKPLFVYGLPLLFLASPIQTESVAYLSSRSELLAAIFYISALAVFASRLREERPWLTAACTLVCIAGAAASKQDKITLPAAILLLDWLLLSKRNWRGLTKSWPTYGSLAAGAAVGFVVLIKPFLFAVSAGFNLDWKTYLFTQFRMYFRYIRQLTLPTDLNIDPDIAPSHSLAENFSWLALIALIGLVVAAYRLRVKAPLASFGILFFLLVLAPTTSFFPLLDFAAERRLYLPSIGFFLVLLNVVSLLARPGSRAVYAGLGAILFAYSLGTVQRSIIWSSELLLWNDSVTKSPNKARPWTWLGRSLDHAGRIEEATGAWERAESLLEEGTREHAYVLNNIGLARAQMGEYEIAIDYYKRALKVVPRDTRIRSQLAVAQIRAGKEEEGWENFRIAFRRPANVEPEALVLRGQENYQRGRYRAAVGDFREAARQRPEDPEIRHNLEVAEERLRQEEQRNQE